MLPEGISKSVEKKLIVVPEQQRFQDGFKAPTKFYIIDAFNDAIFIRTRDRLKAQEIVDSIYGKGFFTIKQVVVAQTR